MRRVGWPGPPSKSGAANNQWKTGDLLTERRDRSLRRRAPTARRASSRARSFVLHDTLPRRSSRFERGAEEAETHDTTCRCVRRAHPSSAAPGSSHRPLHGSTFRRRSSSRDHTRLGGLRASRAQRSAPTPCPFLPGGDLPCSGRRGTSRRRRIERLPALRVRDARRCSATGHRPDRDMRRSVRFRRRGPPSRWRGARGSTARCRSCSLRDGNSCMRPRSERAVETRGSRCTSSVRRPRPVRGAHLRERDKFPCRSCSTRRSGLRVLRWSSRTRRRPIRSHERRRVGQGRARDDTSSTVSPCCAMRSPRRASHGHGRPDHRGRNIDCEVDMRAGRCHRRRCHRRQRCRGKCCMRAGLRARCDTSCRLGRSRLSS